MTVKELINQIDTSKPSEAWCNLESLAEEVGISGYLKNEEDGRLKGYYYQVWNCSDTWVGSIFWFLDGEFVFYTFQSGRKFPREYTFASKETHEKIVNYILSKLVVEEQKLEYIDFDEELDEKYSLSFNSSIIQEYGYWQGEKVEIVKTYFPYDPKSNDSFSRVDIKVGGEIKSVDVVHLLFDWGHPNRNKIIYSPKK